EPGSGTPGVELEQIDEFGDDEQEPELVVGVPEDDHLPSLGRASLDQHQDAESRGVDLPGAAEIDDQVPGPVGQRVQQLDRGLAKLDPGVETQAVGRNK